MLFSGITRPGGAIDVEMAKNNERLEAGLLFNQFLPQLQIAETEILAAQQGRLHQQEAGEEAYSPLNDEEMSIHKSKIREFLVKKSSKTAGFMLWLDRGNHSRLKTDQPSLIPHASANNENIKKIAR